MGRSLEGDLVGPRCQVSGLHEGRDEDQPRLRDVGDIRHRHMLGGHIGRDEWVGRPPDDRERGQIDDDRLRGIHLGDIEDRRRPAQRHAEGQDQMERLVEVIAEQTHRRDLPAVQVDRSDDPLGTDSEVWRAGRDDRRLGIDGTDDVTGGPRWRERDEDALRGIAVNDRLGDLDRRSRQRRDRGHVQARAIGSFRDRVEDDRGRRAQGARRVLHLRRGFGHPHPALKEDRRPGDGGQLEP